MATRLVTLISGVATTVTGSSYPMSAGTNTYTIQVVGITTATVQIEGTLDGATWVKIGSDITSDGMTFVVDKPHVAIRAKISAHTTGTVYVYALI